MNCSGINFACIIREDNGKEHTIQRFYYPDPLKEVSYHAIKINNLTNEKISNLRDNNSYSIYFKDDEYIETIFEDNVNLLVGHNIKFDINFISSAFRQNSKVNKILASARRFCTMENNKRNGKTLNLQEVCKLYNIEIDPENYHNALWDTIAVKENIR